VNASPLLRSAAVFVAVFAFGSLSGSSFHVVPTVEGPWRGLLDPPAPLRIASAVALALLAVALERSRPRVLGPMLSLGVAAAAPLIPVSTGALLPLLLFQGPALALVLACAAGVALVELLPRPTRPWPWLVPFGAALAFFALLSTRLPGPAGAQGDEPHYLTMAESLRSDHDLDLRDEFQQRAYRSFYPGELSAHTSPASPRRQLYSIHTPGLPALVLPAYALGGAAAVRGFLVLITAAAAALVYALLRGVLRDETPARAGFAAFVGLAPIAFYANQIYPEVPAAFATAVFLHTSRRDANAPSLLAAGVLAGALLWIHPKFLPLAVTGLVLTLLRPRAGAPWRVGALLLFAAAFLALLSWMNLIFGRPSLTAAYGAGAQQDVAIGHWLRGLPGLLVDREFGLLLHAPLWALAALGVRPLWRDHPGDLMRAAVLAFSSILVGAAYSMWWGGTCPPGRFLVPAMPSLALLLAYGIGARPRLAAGLFGLSLGVVLVAADTPRALHNRADSESALLRVIAPALRLDRALPSLVGARVEWDPLGAGAIDPRRAALCALREWDGANVASAAGRIAPEQLLIPLLDAPWRLAVEETQSTPRLSLPAGLYELRVRGRVEPGLSGRAVRIVVTLDERDIARVFLGSFDPQPTVEVDVPPGAERRLEVWATALQDGGTIEAIELQPRRVVPRGRRSL